MRQGEEEDGVGAQKMASVGGDDNIARSKPQSPRRTHLDMADLSDFVIDWLIDGFQYYYNIIIFSFIFGLLGAVIALGRQQQH